MHRPVRPMRKHVRHEAASGGNCLQSFEIRPDSIPKSSCYPIYHVQHGDPVTSLCATHVPESPNYGSPKPHILENLLKEPQSHDDLRSVGRFEATQNSGFQYMVFIDSAARLAFFFFPFPGGIGLRRLQIWG